ncbi:hypothetical protein V5O48_003752 [Marasmius crinis-equi]|uniref:PHD-type domain-containing protein n=1 Tax=Marasmius crinis-equi TaxID=585013 RepID=A0ABR3FS14_9AGAR
MPGVPVFQPSHLEGDATFATEILPGPPPIGSVQSSLIKRDPKKPATMYSYLPASDPGTTYSGIMHGTLIGQDAFSQRKRGVDKSNNSLAVGRAQRAEARSQNLANSTTSAPDPTSMPNEPAPESQPPPDTDIQMIDAPSVSRSASVQPVPEPKSDGPSRPRRKDKGKAKEGDPVSRVKEEPRATNLHTPEPNPNLLNNNDHCSACRSQGALVYCDGCPRAFHLWCLDPPMDSVDEGDSAWFCPGCAKPKNRSPCEKPPPPTFLDPVIQALENSLPSEFQLPEDIRTFFKDVGTNPKGAYVDTSEIKPPRLNRHGQLEDRDAHRLRDRNGQPVLCFRCGTSALPENVAATAPSTKRVRKATEKAMQYEVWKDMISCDYCNLHWHLDCLDPPLSSMPSFSKKWMCPNHAERAMPTKRRIPKQNATPVEISKPSQWNNGNIEILESDISPPVDTQRKVAVDEVLINGRRYRVPERIILLDFWNKLNKGAGNANDGEDGSGMSSPLTSLSSLEEDESGPPPASSSRGTHDLRAAQLLFDFHKGTPPAHTPSTSRGRANGTAVKKEPAGNAPPPLAVEKPVPQNTKAPRASKSTAQKRLAAKAPANGVQSPIVESASVPAPPAKRRRSTVVAVASAPSTRELRSRSKNADKNRQFGEEEILSTPPLAAAPSTSKSRVRVNVKVEEPDISLSLTSGVANETVSAPVPAKKPVKRARTSRKKDAEEAAEEKPKEKRTRKRKERDEDPYVDTNASKPTKEKSSKTYQRQVPPSTTSLSSLSTVTMTPAPATPSLKIRLPRLTLNGSPVVTTTPKTTMGASTRLS